MAHLKESEVAGFGKYLRCSYPNEGNAQRVYDYYQPFFPKKEQPERMDLPYAYREIYGTEIGPGLRDPKKLWNAFSKLHGWLKEFLIVEKLKKDSFNSDMLWLEVLAEKEMTAEYAKEVVQVSEIKYQKMFGVKACQQQIELSQHFKQQLVQRSYTPDNKALELCILNIKDSADFISLKMYCEWLALKITRPSKENIEPDKHIITPLTLIYNQIYLMITTGEVDHYMEIEKMLYAHITEIPPDETNNILRYLQNFAANKTRVGDAKAWGKRFHELNKALLEKDVHAAQNTMSATNFQNIINAACSVSDFDWASDFIANYSPYLPQKVRSKNVWMAQAIIAFEQKDFNRVITLTKKPQFKDEIHMIRSKTLQLRALYELGMDTTKVSGAFETYLQRHKYPAAKLKEATIAFMQVFKMLVDLSGSKKELEQALKANPEVILRDWLEEKIRSYKSTVYRRNE